MCLAIPGKVVEISDDSVIVDYYGEKRNVKKIFDVKIGDYVIISNKIIIEVIPKKDAIKSLNFIKNACK